MDRKEWAYQALADINNSAETIRRRFAEIHDHQLWTEYEDEKGFPRFKSFRAFCHSDLVRNPYKTITHWLTINAVQVGIFESIGLQSEGQADIPDAHIRAISDYPEHLRGQIYQLGMKTAELDGRKPTAAYFTAAGETLKQIFTNSTIDGENPVIDAVRKHVSTTRTKVVKQYFVDNRKYVAGKALIVPLPEEAQGREVFISVWSFAADREESAS